MTDDLFKTTAAWDVQYTSKKPGDKWARNHRAHVLAHTMEDAIAVVRAHNPIMVLVGIQKRAGKNEVLIDRGILEEIRDVEELRAKGDLDPRGTSYDLTNEQLGKELMADLDLSTLMGDGFASVAYEAARRLMMSKETPHDR